MTAIFKREIRSYFYTPAAYVYFTVMFAFFGLFFFVTNIIPRQGGYSMEPATASFAPVLSSMVLVLLFTLPILVMKLISEEKRQKTDQLLHTTPTTTVEIVLAKYLSALTIFSVSLFLSFIYPMIIYLIGNASLKYLIAAYLGLFLVGACFIAICLFASALSESQIVAGFLGFFFILSLWLLQFTENVTKIEFFREAIGWFSLMKRFDDFLSGTIRVAPTVYYISVVIIFVFLTIRAVDKRRWTEG